MKLHKKMIKIGKELAWINDTFNAAKEVGVFKVIAEDKPYDGRHISLQGKDVVFMGNCSYMGLDQNLEMRKAAIEAIEKYGLYFSSSRSFVSMEIIEQMEDKLEQMFGKPVIATTSTTFAHISNFPILIGKKDAIIIDNYVHNSLQTAINICRNDGIHVELLRHSRIDLLEDRIKDLKETHENIWYMIDGVYSMMGDGAPMKELEHLMNQYEQFYVYADDSHGTSWIGKNGAGYVLNEIEFHEKLYLGMSLSKGFGVGGGLMVYPNKKIKELVKNCGKTMIFSGPPHPSTAMAAIKSAEIHMSPSFANSQLDLKRLIEYFWKRATQRNLPLSGNYKTPIFFVGIGNPENIVEVSRFLIDNGFFVSPCSYPSVPLKNTGIRITLTLAITYADIDKLIDLIDYSLLELEKAGRLDREKTKTDFLPRKLKSKTLV